MKKIVMLYCLVALSSCTNLTRQEEIQLQILKSQGVTIDKAVGNWERPANPAGAALLNVLPGVGNFYLAAGNGGQSSHYLYGSLNLLLWPFSILWGVPEAAVDANTINKREMLYYYQYDVIGKEELKKAGIKID